MRLSRQQFDVSTDAAMIETCPRASNGDTTGKKTTTFLLHFVRLPVALDSDVPLKTYKCYLYNVYVQYIKLLKILDTVWGVFV